MSKDLLPIFRPNYNSREVKAVTEVLNSGWIGLGPKTTEFEKRFASYVGSKYAVALNSATAALHLSLVVSKVGKGDEVILPSLTFVSTAHAVMYVGAKPVFADIADDTLCLDPEDVRKKITSKTKAIIPVHYGGHPCDLRSINKIAKAKNLTVIEDAAHACGSTYYKKHIGNISPLTCFSFHAVKNLATGDGGMITTNNSKIADQLKRLRWVGIDKDTWRRLKKVTQSGKRIHQEYGWYYEINDLGYKCHMNDIAAALGLVQLEKLEKSNIKRRVLADRYNKKLARIPEIRCPVIKPNIVSAQHNYVIRTPKRDQLHVYLREKGISSGVHYLPLHMQPFYKRMYPNLKLPVTDSTWSQLLTLPLYPALTFKQQDKVIDTIINFFENEK